VIRIVPVKYDVKNTT